MPSASDRMATIANPEFFRNILDPKRASSARSLSRRHLQVAPHFLFKLRVSLLPPPETHRPPPRFLTSLLPYFLTSLPLASSLLLWLQHARDGVRNLRPPRTFSCQLLLSGRRQLVKLCPLLVFGDSPFRR